MPASAGAANSAQSPRVSAPSAFCCSFTSAMHSWITSSRFTGSSMSVARLANMDVTRLPSASFSSSLRTDTGTIATSGPSGCSPCSSR